MTTSSAAASVTLSDGAVIPTVGLGVYMITDSAQCTSSVESALESGYRLVDTAVVYGNERAVGRGLAASPVPREDVFVTTKVWLRDYDHDKAAASIDASLERLGVDYIDLMLLHQPFPEYLGAWRAMEEAVDSGKLRSIGVSNFEIEDIDTLLAQARIRPVLNQIEMHPYYQRPELVSHLRDAGIAIESWAPLGHGRSALLAEPMLADLAQKHGRSVHQVLLRWHLQQGFIVIPKSTNPAHIASNLDVFNFTLDDEDMSRFAALDTGKPNRRMPRWLQRAVFPRFPARQLP